VSRAAAARAALRLVAVLAGSLLGVVVLGMGVADAHVSVSPASAPRGSTAELTFRVPNEESKAATTSLQLQIPTDSPIAQLLARPIPGWKVAVHTTKLSTPLVTDDGTFTSVVDEVTWSGGRIEPGEYQDFALSADPLPDTGNQVVFKALQTYSNGDIVRWIDLQQPGQDEPEHPAPVLALTAASGAEPTPSNPTQAPGSTPATSPMVMSGGSGSDGDSSSWAGVVAVIALVIALAAAGGVALLYQRHRPDER
jgi:uncharacterized protein YcnI